MFQTAENTRKQGVPICRKIQENKVFESAKKCKETRCFNLLKIQGNDLFQSVEKCKETKCLNLPKNTRRQHVSNDRPSVLYQSHTTQHLKCGHTNLNYEHPLGDLFFKYFI